jgi:hypothetical protein
MNLEQLTDEQVLQLYRQMKPQRGASLGDSIKDSPVGGFVRGLRDPIDAGAQMLVHALPDSVVAAGDALGNKLVDWGLPVARSSNTRGTSPSVDEINRRAEVDYQQNWRGGENVGIDWSRIGGNIAGTLPVARLLPFAAATTAGRMGKGVAAGAGLATLQPVDMSEPDTSFLEQKAKQAGMGAAFGGLGVPVGNLAAKGASAVAQKASQGLAALRNRGDLTINANIGVHVDNALRDAGVDLAAIPAGVRESLRQDVAKAMSAGETVSPAALSRG